MIYFLYIILPFIAWEFRITWLQVRFKQVAVNFFFLQSDKKWIIRRAAKLGDGELRLSQVERIWLRSGEFEWELYRENLGTWLVGSWREQKDLRQESMSPERWDVTSEDTWRESDSPRHLSVMEFSKSLPRVEYFKFNQTEMWPLKSLQALIVSYWEVQHFAKHWGYEDIQRSEASAYKKGCISRG